MESVCSDNFFSLVKNVDAKTKPCLLRVVTHLIEAVRQTPDEADEIPGMILIPYERLEKMLLAMVPLLSPIPNLFGANPGHVNDLRKYRGDSVEESTLRDILIAPGDKASPNLWVKMYDEMLAKGEASLKSMPQLDSFKKVLEAMSNLSDIKTLDIELLAGAARGIPKLAKEVRSGLCDEHMDLLQKVLINFASFLVKTQPGQVDIGTSNFDAVQSSLSLFGSVAGVAKLCEQLSKWKKQSEKMLQTAELLTICRGFPEDLNAPMDAANLGGFLDAWNACPKQVLEDLEGQQRADYFHALNWIFRVLAGVIKARPYRV